MSLSSFFKRKRNPQHELDVFLGALQTAAGPRLKSVILFGSMASGEFHETHSDINLLVVLDTMADLAVFSRALRSWAARGHTLPILLTATELPALSRSLPIEFLDIQEHYRVIHGENVLQNTSVDSRNLRAHCEQQLALVLIKLRQGFALAGKEDARIRDLLISSAPSVLTIYRALLRLSEKVGKISKVEAAERLAAQAGADPALLRRIHDFRFSRKTDNLEDLVTHYLKNIETVSAYLQTL